MLLSLEVRCFFTCWDFEVGILPFSEYILQVQTYFFGLLRLAKSSLLKDDTKIKTTADALSGMNRPFLGITVNRLPCVIKYI